MSAYFPVGMEMYNNTQTQPFTAQYATTKGTGENAYPVGVTSGNQRPLTNKDYTNTVLYKQGATRPQKWAYRKGLNERISMQQSNKTLMRQLMDTPSGYMVKQNNPDNGFENERATCDTACKGISMVANYKPDSYYLSNNPRDVCTTPQFCCNEEKKALRRCRPASTLLKKNYYTTLAQYRQNRCNTYEQKAFNFIVAGDNVTANNKPGAPESTFNTYVGQCYPINTTEYSQQSIIIAVFQLLNNAGYISSGEQEAYDANPPYNFADFYKYLQTLQSSTQAIELYENYLQNPYIGIQSSTFSNMNDCKRVVYKPNNYQFAQQGAVESSTATFKRVVSIAYENPYNFNIGGNPNTPFLTKRKIEPQNRILPVFFRQASHATRLCGGSIDVLAMNNVAPSVANYGISATNPAS